MEHTIKNACLAVTASEEGAGLRSILGADGTEYLWQGNPSYWEGQAPNIFPYVARLTGGRYLMDGELYRLPIHGLADYSRFTLLYNSGEAMGFELRDSVLTMALYPRRFAFRVLYALEGPALRVRFEVENLDGRPLYFGLGGHPGFRVPLAEGLRFEDYRLRFGESCRPVRVGFTADCFVSGEETPFPLEGGTVLPLRHGLFDGDAVVLKDMARTVTLETPLDGHAVTVRCPQMPYLGFWHMPHTDAPYVCIEPWCSLPARAGATVVFEQQEDLLRLAPGGLYTNDWSIEIS